VELLLRDIGKWGGNDALMRQIVKRVTEIRGSPVSLHNLQEETEITSQGTVSSYLEYLRDSFVLAGIYKLDQSKGSPNYRGEKKIYFEDPFIFHALRSWSIGAEPYEEAFDYLKKEENLGKLTESVVANHLVRLLFGYSVYPIRLHDPSILLSEQEEEGARLCGKTVGSLPSYQGQISGEDPEGRRFRHNRLSKGGNASSGLLLTKDSLKSRRSCLELPIPVFLLLV